MRNKLRVLIFAILACAQLSCMAQQTGQTSIVSLKMFDAQKVITWDDNFQPRQTLTVDEFPFELGGGYESIANHLDSIVAKHGFLKKGRGLSDILSDTSFVPTNVLDVTLVDAKSDIVKNYVVMDEHSNKLYILVKNGKKSKETPIVSDITLSRLIWSIIIPPIPEVPDFDAEEIKAKREVAEKYVASVLDGGEIKSAYLLDPNADKEEKIRGFSVIHCSDEIPENHLVSILSGSTSYVYSNVAKNCVFLPDVALAIEKDGQSIDVLIAFYCGTIGFYTSDFSVAKELSSKGYEEVLSSVMKFFPNDEYLKHYKR